MSASAPAAAPKTRDELAAIVAAAAGERRPVTAEAVSIRGLDRVVAHEPGDLTLTAECGMTIAAVQELLAGHRQFLAVDPPDPVRATLGDVITSGRDGPLAARFGSVRDQVLGLTVVNGDGRITRCGGRVVKNVTGYDLCRLYTGSGGGLGILVEATLRLRSLPESCRRLDFRLATASQAFARAWHLRSKVPEVASIQIAGGTAADKSATVTAIVAGLGTFVEAAAGEISAVMGAPAASSAWDPRSFRIARPPGDAVTVLVAAPPGGWDALGGELRELLTPAAGWVHDVLRGVRESWHAPEPSPFADPLALDALLTKHEATLDCPGDPAFPGALATRFPGQVPGGIALMRSLKRALDPAGILNPGGTVYG